MKRIILGVSKRARQLIKRLTLRFFHRSDVLAGVYYGIVSRAFRSEHGAVAAGLAMYQKRAGWNHDSSTVLRRNIHRIEKGLVSEPPKPVFAESYILETVDAFVDAVDVARRRKGQLVTPDPELVWANDVLSMYFARVRSTEKVQFAWARFKTLAAAESYEKCLAPYERQAQSAVSKDSFLALCRTRRSVRSFDTRSVERREIDSALTAALQSPSACNRQAFQYHILDEPKMIQSLANLTLGASGFGNGIPVLVAVSGQLRAYFDERDRHVVYVDGALSAMAFILALETVGLSSCVVNWPDLGASHRGAAKLLHLDRDERIILLVAVGYASPHALVPYSQKKPLWQVRRYNGSKVTDFESGPHIDDRGEDRLRKGGSN